MISEFQDLSDKITKLAELTETLRRENAELRQANANLRKANLEYVSRFAQAKQRLQSLVGRLTPEAAAEAKEAFETKAADVSEEGGPA